MATQCIFESTLLLWVDRNIDQNAAATQQTLERLRAIVRHVKFFTTIDACMQFLQSINKEKALIITSGSMGQDLVRHIHALPQIEAIYIFCGNVARNEVWTKKWSKIRAVHNRIDPICEALRTAVKQSSEDHTPISFAQQATAEGDSEDDLNRLEPSFMYTTLFKGVLLDMEHEPDERQALIKFCRAQFHYTDPSGLEIVEEFNSDYRPGRAIWWYTRECFLYRMLNGALRSLQSHIIVDMGFFLRDLHHQLLQLHQKQFGSNRGPPLPLYRGQSVSIDDFSKLKKTQGGLIAFNSFLSTSRKRSVSLDFAQKSSNHDGMVGILFVMEELGPNFKSATFADIEKLSYFKEEEILFSMHTVFRIGQVTPLDDSQRLFEVRLKLTSDTDPALRLLTDRMEKDIAKCHGWDRVGRLLVYVGQMNKAEELYLALLKKYPNERDQWLYYHQLGLIKDRQGDHREAVQYYDKAFKVKEKIPSLTDSRLATSYNNMGAMHDNMGDYSQALTYYKEALRIWETTLPANHSHLATCYNNIGAVHDNMGDYSQALSYYKKSLAIDEKTLPANHPNLATSYNNIGLVYDHMREYSQALSYYKKGLAIDEKTLPADHPNLATSYNNIGLVYDHMREYSQALSYYNKALDIRKKALPKNHPDVAISCSNIGATYQALKQYSTALPYFQRALEIRQRALPPGHPEIQNTLKWLKDVQTGLSHPH